MKIVENHLGRAFIKTAQIVLVRSGTPASGPGSIHRAAGGFLQQLQVNELGQIREMHEAPDPGCRISIAEQLDALRRLEPGWLDGEGPAYSAIALDRAREILDPLVGSFGLPRPFVYPTADGEIRAEWPASTWDVVVTFDPKVERAELIANATTRDETEEATYVADGLGNVDF